MLVWRCDMRDWWCPNCKQLVHAVAEPNHLLNILVGATALGSGWLTSLVQSLPSSIMTAIFAGVVAAAFAHRYNSVPRCPICKSANVEQQAPTE